MQSTQMHEALSPTDHMDLQVRVRSTLAHLSQTGALPPGLFQDVGRVAFLRAQDWGLALELCAEQLDLLS